jgi:selenocysteine lyase/cysteine desulfurase
VSHVSNVTGHKVDLPWLADFCSEAGVYLIVDGAQSAGRWPKPDADGIYCFSGHKYLMGPQGTGGLTVRGVSLEPWKLGGTGQRSLERDAPDRLPDRLEPGTQNAHSLAGLWAGVQFIEDITVEHIRKKEAALTERFVERVLDNKKIRLYGDYLSHEKGPIVSLSVKGYTSDEVSDILAQRHGIATRPGLHCAPLLHQALGTEKTGLVRFSFSYFNEADEIDRAAKALVML